MAIADTLDLLGGATRIRTRPRGRGYRRVECDLQDQGVIEMGFAQEMLLQAQERQDAETRAEELGCAAKYRAACQLEDFIAELEIQRADIDRDIAACKRAAARAVFEEADCDHECLP